MSFFKNRHHIFTFPKAWQGEANWILGIVLLCYLVKCHLNFEPRDLAFASAEVGCSCGAEVNCLLLKTNHINWHWGLFFLLGERSSGRGSSMLVMPTCTEWQELNTEDVPWKLQPNIDLALAIDLLFDTAPLFLSSLRCQASFLRMCAQGLRLSAGQPGEFREWPRPGSWEDSRSELWITLSNCFWAPSGLFLLKSVHPTSYLQISRRENCSCLYVTGRTSGGRSSVDTKQDSWRGFSYSCSPLDQNQTGFSLAM